jgi:hypothetical protein
MATAVTVRDETTSGATTNELTLEFLTERVTVRELIRSRVYQEVTEYNARVSGAFRGLVQPRGSEAVAGGGFRLRQQRRLDWQEQYERALKGFAANGFLLLVDDRQVTDLEEEVVLRHDTAVTFLRLVPLIGG